VRFEPLELHDTVRLSRIVYIPQNANKKLISKLIQERDSLACLLDSLEVKEYLEYRKVTESHDTIEIKVNTIKNTFDSVSLRFSPRIVHVPEENYSFELKEESSWQVSPFITFGIGALAGAAGYYLITK
jgi:hypothetical protein